MNHYSEADEKFLEQVIITLYDEEVARHPEGIHYEVVREIVAPKITAIVANMRRNGGAS